MKLSKIPVLENWYCQSGHKYCKYGYQNSIDKCTTSFWFLTQLSMPSTSWHTCRYFSCISWPQDTRPVIRIIWFVNLFQDSFFNIPTHQFHMLTILPNCYLFNKKKGTIHGTLIWLHLQKYFNKLEPQENRQFIIKICQ